VQTTRSPAGRLPGLAANAAAAGGVAASVDKDTLCLAK